ncbi:MarR family transcriptional regulator [Amycolatopsis sp. NPDC004079]|uniref:MarR family winged helix-turn-helix transcriptional regulator n=1 Tax=Amycolatopsis halotolerans TaxID=330083 RepID=A0ABV7QDU0_9PSEU
MTLVADEETRALADRINQLIVDMWAAVERKGPRYDEFELTNQQHLILGLIIRDPDVTPKQLAEKVGVSKGAISQHLARLEQDGYLSREKSPADGRVQVFRLRDHGVAYQRAMEHYDRYLEDSYAANLTPAEMEQIAASLEKLKRAFEN